jgi:hypothetical protein
MKILVMFFLMGITLWAKKGLPAIMFEWSSKVCISSLPHNIIYSSRQRLPLLRLWLLHQRWQQAAGELHQDLATGRAAPLCGGGPFLIIIIRINLLGANFY